MQLPKRHCRSVSLREMLSNPSIVNTCPCKSGRAPRLQRSAAQIFFVGHGLGKLKAPPRHAERPHTASPLVFAQRGSKSGDTGGN